MRQDRFRLDVPLIYGAFALAVFTLTRLALALYAGRDAVPFADWPAAFAKGLWFDLAVICALLAPLWFYDALLPDRVRASRVHRALRLAGFLAAVVALLFAAVAEITFWIEFAARFNFIAVDYLLYTHEVIGNIRESYPVNWILAGIFAAGLVVTLALKPAIDRGGQVPLSRRSRLLRLAAAVALPAVALSVARVEQMEGSGNAYADELAGNGLFTFVAAARRNDLDYDRFYATIEQDRADHLLKTLGVERKPLKRGSDIVNEEHEETEEHLPMMPGKPRHVVMVTIESMSAEFVGAYGARQGLTPNLDRLASEGLRFANFYATGTRTVRGLEAVSLGTPPVPGQAIPRRPGNERERQLGQALVRARDDHVQPPAVHLPRRAHRHPLARRARRRRQVHRLGDRPVRRAGTREAVVRRHAVRVPRRPLRGGRGEDRAAGGGLSHPADPLGAEAGQARRLRAGREPGRPAAHFARRIARRRRRPLLRPLGDGAAHRTGAGVHQQLPVARLLPRRHARRADARPQGRRLPHRPEDVRGDARRAAAGAGGRGGRLLPDGLAGIQAGRAQGARVRAPLIRPDRANAPGAAAGHRPARA
jgi:hypothetical protein